MINQGKFRGFVYEPSLGLFSVHLRELKLKRQPLQLIEADTNANKLMQDNSFIIVFLNAYLTYNAFMIKTNKGCSLVSFFESLGSPFFV